MIHTDNQIIELLAAYAIPGSPSVEEAKRDFPHFYKRQLEDATIWFDINKPKKLKDDNINDSSTVT